MSCAEGTRFFAPPPPQHRRPHLSRSQATDKFAAYFLASSLLIDNEPTQSFYGIGTPHIPVSLLMRFTFVDCQPELNSDPISPSELREQGPLGVISPRKIGIESRGAYTLDQLETQPRSLNDIRGLIENDPILAQYKIISLRAFRMPWATAIMHGTVSHRFILLELQLDDEKLWLKLERRPDSKIALIRGFGCTTAKDEVRLHSTRTGPLYTVLSILLRVNS